MRSPSLASLLLALTIPVLATSVSAQPQRHTVLDYYKILPERFFEPTGTLSSARARLKWLRGGFAPSVPADNRSVVDIQHDFMRVPGDGAQFGLDIAIFRFRGQETLAVRKRYGVDEDLSFWHLRGVRLVEVTKQVFPAYFGSSSDYIITVPRYGTTIQATKSGWPHKPPKQMPVKFLWRGGRFIRG